MRLERRILLIIAVLIILPSLGSNVARIILDSRSRLTYEAERNLNQLLVVVNQPGPQPTKSPQGLQNAFWRAGETLTLEVITSRNHILTADHPTLPMQLSRFPEEVGLVVATGEPISRLLVVEGGEHADVRPLTTADYAVLVPYYRPIVQEVWVPIRDEQGVAVVAVVYVRFSLDRALASLRLKNLFQFVLTVALVALVCLVLRWALGRWVERPLAALGGVVACMAAGDRTARAAVGPPDAIGRLAREFNALAETLVRTEDEASRDPVIGLLNQRALHRALARGIAQADRRGQPLALLMLDLDGFKLVNDTWGHQAGDTVLRLVGEALLRQTRRSDVVGRYGGDEFLVILPGSDAAAARELLGRLRDAVGNIALPDLPTAGPLIGVSIGCAAYPDDAADADALIARADAELYAMKEAGRAARADASLALAGRVS